MAVTSHNRKVMLMATCLCDAFFFEVAKATYEVLEYLGCEVIFPEDQTCCGQPAFNSGDWVAARKVVRHTAGTFGGELPIVIPSGSCTAMLAHGAPLAFAKAEQKEKEMVGQLKNRSFEIADYLVNVLGITQIPGKLHAKVALHQACHTRGTGTVSASKQLLNSIEGLEILEYGEKDQCCGFGGTFSVSFPHISSEMGQLKIENLLESKPDYIISNDMSCLMHQKGLADKKKIPFETRHIIQIIRESLKRELDG